MVPPKMFGKIVNVFPKGTYNVSQTICTVEFEDKQKDIKMSHFWPVRNDRPFADKLPGKVPLLTG